MQMCLMVDYHVPNKMDIDWVYTIFRQTLIRPNLFAWVETEFFMSAEPQKAGFVCSKALQKGLCVKAFRKTIWQLKHFAKPRPKEKWTYAYTLSMVPVSFSELNPWIPLICTSPSPCYFSSPMHHQLSKKVGRCLLWVSLPPRHHQDAVAHEPLESSALLRCPELSWPQLFFPMIHHDKQAVVTALAHQWRTQSPLNLWGSAGLPCEDLILLHLI